MEDLISSIYTCKCKNSPLVYDYCCSEKIINNSLKKSSLCSDISNLILYYSFSGPKLNFYTTKSDTPGLIKCLLKRVNDEFQLYLDTSFPLFSELRDSYKQHTNIRTHKNNTLIGMYDPLLIKAKMYKKYMKSNYIIYDLFNKEVGIVLAENWSRTRYKLIDSIKNKLLSSISFKSNFHSPVSVSIFNIQNNELRNYPPLWNNELGCYTMKFDNNRMIEKSALNIKFTLPNNTPILQFGATTDPDVFVLDYSSNITLLESLGICLSIIDSCS